MPNHIHGVLFLYNTDDLVITTRNNVEDLTMQDRRQMLLFKIIGWFKMNSAKQLNLMLNNTGNPFWQRNYYEYIFRDEKDLLEKRQYILNNPAKWYLDRNNPINLGKKDQGRGNS